MIKKVVIFLSLVLAFVTAFASAACKKSIDTEYTLQDQPKTTCVVTFDSDSSDGVVEIVVEKGKKITEPKTPTKTTVTVEYEFLGWFNGSSKWDFENGIVTEDMTLVAHWEVVGNYTEPVLPKD